MGVYIKVLLNFSLKILLNGIILVIFLFILNRNSFCQKPDDGINIEYSVNGDQLIVEGTFINDSPAAAEVFYHLIIDKESKSGNSKTDQSGEVEIPLKSKITLSRSSVDLKADAIYLIHLTVQSGKKILADKELKLNGSEIQKH